jgi:hypothetical protein
MPRRPKSEAVALLLIGGITGSSMAADAPGAEPVRQIRYSTELRANASNTERYVADGVCERRGVQQMSEILKRADFEEMWAFLPRPHGARSCQWHELGREETAERDSATLRVDMAYLQKLMSENAEVHVYHFHPLKYFECASRASCPQRALAGEHRPFDRRWITDLLFSMPSPSDVHFMMDVTSRFYRRYQPGGTIKHRVVTPYGVVDYALTEKGLAKYDAERNSRSEGLYITWVVASALDDERVEGVIKEHPDSIAGGIRRLAQTLNTEYLRVVYLPSGQIPLGLQSGPAP